MRNTKQEPETFDIDSLPIGIEELAKEEGEKLGLEKGEKIGIVKGEKLGLEKGEKLGLEKGEKLGLEKGHKLGTKKEKERIAINMLEKNMDTVLIEEITGLDREYIQQLKK